MDYKKAIETLTSSEVFHINLGLERISRVLKELGNPQDSLKCIHVAGTNGKGSVCSILDSVLQEFGYKTGLYTSPHIFEYTERIKINGKDISQDDFANLFELVYTTAHNIKTELTEFEILTVIMFLYFARENVEIVILETGLGGRYDATNVIKTNLCSVITQIDLDHTDRLGKTREEIAREKAGIIKQNCPLITSMGYEVIKDKADELDSAMIFTSPYVEDEYTDALSLKGLHQRENLALAICVLENIFPEIDSKCIIRGLKKVKTPFRYEFFKENNLIIDVSHNPNGIEALRNNLDRDFPDYERRFIFGCLNTKDYKNMTQILFRENDEVYIKEFKHPNACSFEKIEQICPVNCQKYNDSIKLDNLKLNIICGSFYMLSEIMLVKKLYDKIFV